METIENFGLQIKSFKNRLKLNEQNYCEVSNVVSLPPFSDWFLYD